MKLYFAFSNIILLTQANIQANVSDEEADLLVWSTPPIDYHLVEMIRDKGIFRNVWYLERPRIWGNKHKWSKIKNSLLKQKFYFEYLGRLFGNEFYDEFVAPGFWNDALIILKYLRRINPNIKIGISEEGLKSYYCGNMHKKLYYMPSYSKKQKIEAYIRGGRLFSYVQRNIVADYLTAPALMRQIVDNKVIALPPVDEKNPLIKSIVDDLFEVYRNKFDEVISEYAERKVYFTDSPASKAYDPHDYSNDILEVLTNEIPLNLLVLKTHVNDTAYRKNFGKNFDQEIFIDRNVYLFEVLFSHIYREEEQKVFIVRNSSMAIYLTQMFKIEPIFIFIHRLSSRYHYGWDDCTDYYVEDLKKNMEHPERVLVPDSYVEFKEILNRVCKTGQKESEYIPEFSIKDILVNEDEKDKIHIIISLDTLGKKKSDFTNTTSDDE